MSREPRPFVVFGFGTTHDALAAEDVLLEAGLDAVPVPAPKVLGAKCGIAIRIPQGQSASAREGLQSASIAVVSEAPLLDI